MGDNVVAVQGERQVGVWSEVRRPMNHHSSFSSSTRNLISALADLNPCAVESIISYFHHQQLTRLGTSGISEYEYLLLCHSR